MSEHARERGSLLILYIVLAAGCENHDVVITRYGDVREAQASNAFARGWLPPLLPESATEIVETNNVQTNVGTGEFNYSIRERQDYIQQLRVLGASEEVRNGRNVFVLHIEKSEWEIFLPPDSSQAQYTVKDL